MTTVAVVVAAAATLFVPQLLAGVLGAPARAALVAIGLLYLPGRSLAGAFGVTSGGPSQGSSATVLARAWNEFESAALCFTLSLAMLVPAAALAWAVGGGPRTAALGMVALTALAARRHRDSRREPCGDAEQVPRALYALVIAATVAVTCTALAFTRTGSVDRWWALAYAAEWAGGAFHAGEPLLGGDNVLPRFALNVWTAALAVWTSLSGADVLWLFERACPVVLLPLSIAAHAMLGGALLGSRRGALLTALAAAACWGGGGPIAALTRAPEDKVLAAIVLAPVLWTSGIHALAATTTQRWTAAAFGAALATAAVHPLGFVLAAGPLAAYAALTAWRVPGARARAALLAAVVFAASALPLGTGYAARAAYVGDGAADLASDHPVARVHRNRSRLVELGDGGYVVDPRLLANPLVAIAVVGLVVLVRRSPRERRFLLPAALAPLAVAFVPPLTAAAGRIVLPWMVHRVLWAVPVPALVAVAADEAVRRAGRAQRGVAVAIAIAFAAVAVAPALDAGRARARAARAPLAFPHQDGGVAALLKAVRALPRDALVAAPHELSERLPALARARVLAMSDRATIVFAGSREAGERRLRARAALFAGVWRHEDGVPDPTHVLAAPGSPALRYCGEERLRTSRFVLCSFRPAAVPPGIRLPEVEAAADGAVRVAVVLAGAAAARGGDTASAANASGVVSADAPANAGRSASSGDLAGDDEVARAVAAECAPDVVRTAVGVSRPRPGPWSAEFPMLACRFSVARPDEVRPRTLVVRPLLGSAVDELTIVVTGTRDGARRFNVRTRRRVRDGETLRFGLPRGAVGAIDVEVTPSFLPFVKLTDLAVTLDPSPRARP